MLGVAQGMGDGTTAPGSIAHGAAIAAKRALRFCTGCRNGSTRYHLAGYARRCYCDRRPHRSSRPAAWLCCRRTRCTSSSGHTCRASQPTSRPRIPCKTGRRTRPQEQPNGGRCVRSIVLPASSFAQDVATRLGPMGTRSELGEAQPGAPPIGVHGCPPEISRPRWPPPVSLTTGHSYPGRCATKGLIGAWRALLGSYQRPGRPC